jgi:hypothetical protein
VTHQSESSLPEPQPPRAERAATAHPAAAAWELSAHSVGDVRTLEPEPPPNVARRGAPPDDFVRPAQMWQT